LEAPYVKPTKIITKWARVKKILIKGHIIIYKSLVILVLEFEIGAYLIVLISI
jgi:hypothetical protein